MKILYIHQYFKTPSEPGGTRSYWLAKELIENGHDVTMLTTSSGITNKKEAKVIDGINIIYLKVPYNQKMSLLKRAQSFVDFMIKSTQIALGMKGIELIIATSTPLTIGFPALIINKIKKVPYVFEVRDLWPEVPIQMGALNNSLVRSLAKWFEKTIYSNARHIIALSPGMRDGVIKTGIAADKVTMIPNMAKITEFWPREKDEELVRNLGLKLNSFKIIHFGSLGLANGANTIIESAKLLYDNSDIEFIFLGGGSTEPKLKELCKEYGLTNVFFLGRFPMEQTSRVVNLCDVSIVSFLDLPILYTNSPNKLFDSLSAGKPIIVNSAGWTKGLVETYNCGYYVNPHKPQDLVDKILYLKENENIVQMLGENSRKLAENKYDKTILSKKFVETIHNKVLLN